MVRVTRFRRRPHGSADPVHVIQTIVELAANRAIHQCQRVQVVEIPLPRDAHAGQRPPRLNGSDFLGSVYLTLSEPKIEFKPVEPRDTRIDLLRPQLGR